MTEIDDGVRGKYGVIASLRRLPDDRVRVVFDDAVAVADSSAKPQQWLPSRLYTWAHFDTAKLKSMQFTDKSSLKWVSTYWRGSPCWPPQMPNLSLNPDASPAALTRRLLGAG